MIEPPPGGLWLGVDLGTSGCRAAVLDRSGHLVAAGRAPLPPPRRRGPCSEQDPRSWREALRQALGALWRELPPDAVGAVCLDGTSGSLLLCDGGGRPLGPALLYDDTRAVEEARRIEAMADPASPARGPASALARLLHLGRQLRREGRLAEVAYAHSPAGWLTGLLLGRWGREDWNNLLKLGHDPLSLAWPGWLLRLLEAEGLPPAWLPRPVPPGAPLGKVAPEAAAELGLASGTTVHAGTTDGVAAFLATGATRPGEAVTSLGSTLILKVLSPSPVASPAHGVYSHRLETPAGTRWLAGGASNAGGAVLLEHFTLQELEALTPHLHPEHPTGLDYYPLTRPGERFPVADPRLPPRLEPRPRDRARFLQAILEGLARIERDGYRRLQVLGAPYPVSVRTVGGGARNPAWQAIRRHLLGVPLVQPLHREAACGAARLAMMQNQTEENDAT